MPDPAMSVLLIAVEDGSNLSRMISHLGKLDEPGRLEILVLSERPEALRLPAAGETPFLDLRAVPADLSTSARARVAGIRAAQAPIVVFVEDHAFPLGRDWVRRHVEAHDAGWAAVGPQMRAGNPASAVGWGNFLVEYAPWLDVPEPTEMESIPGHNSSYKRAVLAEFDNGLEDLLEAEWVLHARMRERGHRLLVDPSVEVAHLNPTGAARAMRLQFLAGRMFAASRSADWPRTRRLLWAAGFPAIAAVRMLRTLRLCAGSRLLRREVPVASVPMSMLLLGVSGAGEALGYAFGDGGRRSALAAFEYSRFDDIDPREPIPFG